MNLPDAALTAAANLPTKYYTPYLGAGVLVSGLNGSQLALELLSGLQEKNDPYFGWHIFELHQVIPLVPCKTGVYSTLDLSSYTGPLITTCPASTLQSRIALGAKVVYYVYDPVILKYIEPQLLETIKNIPVAFIARNKEHVGLLKQLGIECHSCVPNFDFNRLEDIISELFRSQ